MADELYIGVGCLEAQWLPFAVLRHSIDQHASRPVCVEPLYDCGIEMPVPREANNRQKTPFSFQRFLIPEVRAYRGRAIYLDSDMLVFDDVVPLFERDFGGASILAVPHETSVMVLDCQRLTWNIRDLVRELDAGLLSYDALMKCRSTAQVHFDLPSRWNWLDNSPAPLPTDVALAHFTVTTSQPWLTSGHPLGHLWIGKLFSALDAGSIQRSAVEEAVARGFVRPSLLYQTNHRITKKEDIPKEILETDKPFSDYCRSVKYAIVDGFQP